MPVFQPRNRIQILREMVARVVARSKLAGLTRNSVVFHVLAGAANEDAEQYVQLARLRNVFAIDKATGSDLDERAKEVLPGTIGRQAALTATGTVTFTRPGTAGTVAIPVGTQVAAQDGEGQIRFRTTAAGSIPNGSATSGAVDVVCTVAGTRGNVASGTIQQIVTRIAGVTAVTNPAAYTNGADRESDASFRARIKAWVQALTRATPGAIETFALGARLSDGRSVRFTSLVEPAIPTGRVELYIDDGTGAVEAYSDEYIGADDIFLPSAAGGEVNVYTTARPIRDDGSFVLERDSGGGYVPLTRGTDYELQPTTGQIELSTALTTGDALKANYRYYTGLIQEVQRIIDGDSANPITYPGVRAGGVRVVVQAPATVFQTVAAQISVLSGFSPAEVASEVAAAIQDYINNLGVGQDVILSEIIERAMSVSGMFDIRVRSLTASDPAANQVILPSQVARIVAASISLT